MLEVADIEKCISNEYDEVIEKLKDNIISVFVIGSMRDPKQKLKQFNDYDIRFILREMNIDTYNILIDFNKKIKKNVMKLGIDVDYSFIIGPVRHITESSINLLIHCIPMTIESLEGLPLTHRYSYSCNYRILYGEDVLEKFKKIRFSGNDIIECTEGINYCINMINTNTIKYTEWNLDDNRLLIRDKEKIMNKKMLFEVLRYSLMKSLDNTIKWSEWHGKNISFNWKERLLLIDESLKEEDIQVTQMIVDGDFNTYKKNKDKFKKTTIEILEKIKKYIYTQSSIIK